MPEPETRNGSPQSAGRPFPWHCPRCRKTIVRPATIAYRCERLHKGRPVAVEVPELVVPRCGHCGELVFNYATEQQILQALASKEATLAQ